MLVVVRAETMTFIGGLGGWVSAQAEVVTVTSARAEWLPPASKESTPSVYAVPQLRSVYVADVPVTRVHDLRHLHASLLMGAGVPLSAVSGRLGHANPGVTASIYVHALEGADAAAISALDGFGWRRG